MLEWVNSKKAQLMAREDLSEADKIKGLQTYCEEYFLSTESFDRRVGVLESDIRGNMELAKTVFGKDYRNAGLLDIVQDLRTAMDDKLVQSGMTRYRKCDISVCIVVVGIFSILLFSHILFYHI